MMAFCPEGVDMKRLSQKQWYCEESHKANLEYGNRAKEMILGRMREIFNPEKK
jgi:hypothetical protein